MSVMVVLALLDVVFVYAHPPARGCPRYAWISLEAWRASVLHVLAPRGDVSLVGPVDVPPRRY